MVDLFCGCGGFSKGFEREGFSILSGIDNDEDSLNSFQNNFNKPGLKIDLFKDNCVDEISNNVKSKVDVLIGGPPCQGFSLTGTRVFDDPRNKLYLSFFKAVDYFKPKAFLIENVKGMKTLYNGNALLSVVKEIEKRGYSVSYEVLNSSKFGVPQNRERLFLIATKSNKKCKMPNPLLSPTKLISCFTALSDLPSLENDFGEDESHYLNEPQIFIKKL